MEAFVAVSDGSLWTARHGEGPPILFVPGGPGCCDYLGPVADQLADRFTTLRYEPRGCGRSSPGGRFDLDECVDDLEALRAHFGFAQWALFGHSWGANLSLLYALRHPSVVRGLIYVSGNGVQDDRDWHDHYAAARDAGLEAEPDWLFPPDPEVNRRLVAAYRHHVKRPGLLHEIAELRVPSLFLYGERDIRPAWPAEQLAALIPGARFVLLPGADHYVWRDQGERVRDLVVEHLVPA